MHAREASLRVHYDNNVKYYSPLQAPDYFWRLCNALEVEPDASDDHVLDLGCGDGRLLKHIDPDLYVGVDYSMERLTKAQKTWGTGKRFVCSDIYSYLEKTPDRFTLAVAVELLEHLEEPRRVVEGALAVAPVLVGTVPKNHPYKAHLQVYKTIDDVKSQLAPDRVVEVGGHFGCAWTRTG